MISFIRIAVAAVAVTLGLTVAAACAPYVSPCTRLAPPSAQELEVAQTGVEIERATEGVECDLINGQWIEEEEGSSSYGSSHHRPVVPAASAPRSAPRSTVAPLPAGPRATTAAPAPAPRITAAPAPRVTPAPQAPAPRSSRSTRPTRR